jgi:hypothetical protein
VHADRITQMTQSESVHVHREAAGGYYYFEQGKPREEVKIVWYGDETQDLLSEQDARRRLSLAHQREK